MGERSSSASEPLRWPGRHESGSVFSINAREGDREVERRENVSKWRQSSSGGEGETSWD